MMVALLDGSVAGCERVVGWERRWMGAGLGCERGWMGAGLGCERGWMVAWLDGSVVGWECGWM